MAKQEAALMHVGDTLLNLSLPEPIPAPRPAKRGPPPGMFELSITSADIGYTHPLFMNCYLPLRHNARNDQAWQMENGKASLLIRAGMLIDPERPGTFKRCSVPAGSKGRLLMAYVNDYILKHRTRVIPLGESLRKGMSMIGIPIGGKNAKEMQREIENLATAEIVLGTWNERGSAHQNQAKVASNISFWSDKSEEQGSFWQSEMIVSAEYYQAIIHGGMAPVYWPALIGLQHNARAMDIHSFLVYRLRSRLPRPVTLSASVLHGMFGKDFEHTNYFWRRFKSSLLEAHKWYPTARIEISKDRNSPGMTLRSSPPLIPYKKTYRLN